MSTSQNNDQIALSAPMAIGWQSAIPAAMENNACKAFECATSDLDTILDEHNVTALSDLWHKTHTQIIPTLQAMLYPLQSFDSSFDVRLEILKTFRDRVLTRLLENVQFPIPMLQSMICLVSFATSDTSPEHKRFNDIADRILEKQRKEAEERNDMVKLKKIAKARLSVPHSMNTNALRERLFTKKRSITMPSRRFVHFSDELSIDEERPGSFE
ncbi:unnamed protein product [Anisakis simplex]|uniref:Tho2 domain-containing protein n=1 Tax=Anisakis simplex TaxID=6269 RepID=A0A0M3J221_ANISI|nr:unnamed protein product [Anisakis simplex]